MCYIPIGYCLYSNKLGDVHRTSYVRRRKSKQIGIGNYFILLIIHI